MNYVISLKKHLCINGVQEGKEWRKNQKVYLKNYDLEIPKSEKDLAIQVHEANKYIISKFQSKKIFSQGTLK